MVKTRRFVGIVSSNVGRDKKTGMIIQGMQPVSVDARTKAEAIKKIMAVARKRKGTTKVFKPKGIFSVDKSKTKAAIKFLDRKIDKGFKRLRKK